MMKKALFLLCVVFAACQDKPAETKESVLNTTSQYQFEYREANTFTVTGQLPGVNGFNRLPDEAEEQVRPAIWNLSRESAGIGIRFRTNAKAISIKWTLTGIRNYPHISDTGTSGFDLYARTDSSWQFVGVAKPNEVENEALLADNLDGVNTEYLLNLPLYNGVKSLQIGIPEGASIIKGESPKGNIVVYGTSITQGASASRPGMCYTALLGRNLDKNVINLGFSGEGKFEKSLAPYILSVKPELIIIDCTPNSAPEVITKNAPELLAAIRQENSTVPILLLESIIREDAYFKDSKYDFISKQNQALKAVYEQTKDKNLYYLPTTDLIGKDHEGTVDGTHLNDLGFMRLYNTVKEKIKSLPQETTVPN